MNASIYLRPLREEDAHTSYRWRNNPKIWELTGSAPDRHITPEIELNWIRDVLNREYDKRFAICLKESDEYIGNAQISFENANKPEITGIFIGEPRYWNQGLGTQALQLLSSFAFHYLPIHVIYARLREQHNASKKMMMKAGFVEVSREKGFITMTLHRKDWQQIEHSPAASSLQHNTTR